MILSSLRLMRGCFILKLHVWRFPFGFRHWLVGHPPSFLDLFLPCSLQLQCSSLVPCWSLSWLCPLLGVLHFCLGCLPPSALSLVSCGFSSKWISCCPWISSQGILAWALTRGSWSLNLLCVLWAVWLIILWPRCLRFNGIWTLKLATGLCLVKRLLLASPLAFLVVAFVSLKRVPQRSLNPFGLTVLALLRALVLIFESGVLGALVFGLFLLWFAAFLTALCRLSPCGIPSGLSFVLVAYLVLSLSAVGPRYNASSICLVVLLSPLSKGSHPFLRQGFSVQVVESIVPLTCDG